MTGWEDMAPEAGWENDPHAGSIRYLGPILRKTDPRGSLVALRTSERHADESGHVSRGVIMAFADHAIGCAGIAQFGFQQVTIELDIRFVDAARPGDLIEGLSEIVGRVDDLLFLAGHISANGRLIATSQGVWKAVRRHASSPGS